jgi:hypothetical protein
MAFRILNGTASTVSTIDRFIRIHKEHGKRQVVIELKQIQIQIVRFDDSDTDKFVKQLSQLTFTTDNLPVKTFAGMSRDSAKND